MLEKPVAFYRKPFFPTKLQSRRDFSTERINVIGWTNADYLLEKQASVTSSSACFYFDCEIPISVFLNTNIVCEQYLSRRNLLWILIQSKFLLYKEKNFSIYLSVQFCCTLTSCVFLAVWGEEGSDRNVQRDLKLTKNVSSLKYDLPCP